MWRATHTQLRILARLRDGDYIVEREGDRRYGWLLGDDERGVYYTTVDRFLEQGLIEPMRGHHSVYYRITKAGKRLLNKRGVA